MNDSKSSSWLLQCPPGLAAPLKKELVFVGALERKQDVFIKRQRNHDLVFANRFKNSDGIGRLRIAEMILRCPVFGRYKVSKNQLQQMATELRELGPRRLVVTVAGRVFQRQDLARWLTNEMAAREYEFDSEIEDEVWMFCVDEAYYFGIPVQKARDTEGRSERAVERKGSLPPAIAAAVAFAGGVKPDDVVLDPCCGSGTLLAEAHGYAPTAHFIGVDIAREAVEIARENCAFADIRAGDSRKLELSAAPSLVLANLPFGVQFGAKENNPELYRDILSEVLRLRAPTWRAVLLTSDVASLRTAMGQFAELAMEEMFKVKIRGELASCFRVSLKK